MTSRFTRRGFLAAGAGTIGALALAACGSGREGAQTGTAPTGAPVRGGTLVISDTQAVPSWQNQRLGTYSSGNLVFGVLVFLLYFDPVTKKLVPWVASEWSHNPANTEFTFRIRPGITFSDGTPLDAEIVRRNLERLARGDQARNITANPYLKPGFDHAELIADDTVKVVLTRPNQGFALRTSQLQNGIVAASTLELNVDDAGKPENVVSAGPFVFESQVPNQEVVLRRREGYNWAPQTSRNQGPAYLDKVVWRVLPEIGLRTGALQSGQVDIARGIQPVDEKALQRSGYQVLATRPTLGTSNFAAFRIGNPLVSDERVRKALQITINRDEMSRTALSANFPPAKSILNVDHPAFEDHSADLAYNPGRGRQLLDEAGWRAGADGVRVKDGKRLELTVPQDAQQAALGGAWEYIAQQWRQELGVVLNVRNDVTFANAAQTDPQVPVTVSRISVVSLAQQFGAPGNTALLVTDPELVAFRERELNAADDAALAQVQREEQKYLIDKALVIPTFEEAQVYGVSSKVNVEFNATTYPLFHTAWKAG
ncbi:ABC transporter substrate-binding protein [Nocardia cerradoensis]|uniref:ABC transporter substrate-binding protein n=1 Tax=Nocardia cerradoensis TaxID=85688 RepID=UPI000314D52D|nr:ABC transporter substrate-binding protein [Nocardia cerradoensis]NKY45769.1 ABC transporter substrate-binding protein [Nocardia cerradoensis]